MTYEIIDNQESIYVCYLCGYGDGIGFADCRRTGCGKLGNGDNQNLLQRL